MRYIVALTGGIGSGKSTVANAFADLGINVIDADIIARQVVEPGAPALHAIADHFGANMIAADGTLQRRALRERIFANPEEKNWLNALLHPLIQQETQHQIQQATSPYVLWVVPLLVENSLYKKANRVLVVDVSPETQLKRTMQRDDVTREHVEQILAAQATREARLAVADDVIDTMGAGDSYFAAFLCSLLKSSKSGALLEGTEEENAAHLQKAMQIGAAFAAKMCTKEGAFGYGTPIVGRTEL
jgi:dephospho-CoA kinase